MSRSDPRFVLDVHLGALARYLRLLGFDVLYRNDFDDAELAAVAHRQGRILLTRDRRLLDRKLVTQGLWIEETERRRQLFGVVERLGLRDRLRPFTRCLHCNAMLEPVAKDAVAHRLPPRIRREHDDFRICRTCDRVFWQGSHYRRMRRLIAEIGERR